MSSKKKRTILYHFCADEDEAALIRQRLADSGMVSLSAYFRRMATTGYHINMDLTCVREMISLLRRCTNNLKQLSQRADEIRSIHAADVENLRQQYDSLWEAVNKILVGLAKIK